MIEPTHTGTDDPTHYLVGRANVRRVQRWGLPTYELTQDGNVLAHMGRAGWLRIYMGPGQRIETADGDHWRVRAIGARGSLIPVVIDSNGRKVAIAGSNFGTYGITGRDFACTLLPEEKLLIGRANTWTLWQFEDQVATVTRYPLSVEATLPVHLGAVFLSFVLVRHGLPDESAPRVPLLRWS